MKEFVITSKDSGIRLDKYINRILSAAPMSFSYKMLRKKNIVLNDKKASGSELLSEGDNIKFYLADDTFEKFSARPDNKPENDLAHITGPEVVYEDEDILIVNKPSGMLTQRSAKDDVSLNEVCLKYLAEKGEYDPSSAEGFTPGVCNRLDRNTSGLVTVGKTYKGARMLSAAFKDRTVHKYYIAVVLGVMDKDIKLTGSLKKDEITNKVSISDDENDGAYICTCIHPLKHNGELTLVEIELITGKTHQIRAHMAHIGHPLVGDMKYGDKVINAKYRKTFGTSSQLLTCYRMVFPDDPAFGNLSGRTVSVKIPDHISKVM